MNNNLRNIIIALALFALPFVARINSFDGGQPLAREAPPVYNPANVAAVNLPEVGDFVDEPTVGEGLVLIDKAHDNQFSAEEIAYLDARLAARGFQFAEYSGGNLELALRSVSSFVVLTPLQAFDAAEVQAVSAFVARGGRLLMIGDPSRFTLQFTEDDFFNFSIELDNNQIPLNSLANEFGITFVGDYLYNVDEHEGNYRNIIVTESGLAEEFTAQGLEEIVLYGVDSLVLGAGAEPLLTADDKTYSSATDRPGNLVMAAGSADGNVIAFGDIHFLAQPYATVFDNGALIAGLADFLTPARQRTQTLADFPFFLDDEIELIYLGEPDLGAAAFGQIVALQDSFGALGKSVMLSAEPDPDIDTIYQGPDIDTIYLGLFNESLGVSKLLADLDIELLIEPPIEDPDLAATETMTDTVAEEDELAATPVPDDEDEMEAEEMRLIRAALGDIQMAGSALIFMFPEHSGDSSDSGTKFVVLAASADGLQATVDRLLGAVSFEGSDAFADCLVQGEMAFCPTGVSDEEVAFSLNVSGSAEATSSGSDTEETDSGETDDPVIDPPTEPDFNFIGEMQGPITLGESVEGALEEEARHGYLFVKEADAINISAVPAGQIDLIVSVLDENGLEVGYIDSGYEGGEESGTVQLNSAGPFTIVVGEFEQLAGDYTLTVTEGMTLGGGGVLVFLDDDGDAIGVGENSSAELEAILSADYEVTLWSTVADGALPEGFLIAYDLVIWDSGDYIDEEGGFDDDASLIFEYLDQGGKLLIMGAAPPFLGETEIVPLVDVQFNGASVMVEGFGDGTVVEIIGSAETLLSELPEGEEEGLDVFLLRGPAGEGSGNAIGFTFSEELIPGVPQQIGFLILPLNQLPADAQIQLMANFLAFFNLN